MSSRADLIDITKARLRTVGVLCGSQDWDAAAYMMGYALETALKAVTCRALRVNQYPDVKSYKNEKIGNYSSTEEPLTSVRG